MHRSGTAQRGSRGDGVLAFGAWRLTFAILGIVGRLTALDDVLVAREMIGADVAVAMETES
jgi:hypothetical protein